MADIKLRRGLPSVAGFQKFIAADPAPNGPMTSNASLTSMILYDYQENARSVLENYHSDTPEDSRMRVAAYRSLVRVEQHCQALGISAVDDESDDDADGDDAENELENDFDEEFEDEDEMAA